MDFQPLSGVGFRRVDYGDETTPFYPNGASTQALDQYQAHVREEIEMKVMQQDGSPNTSNFETSFGTPKSSERTWVDAKDLFSVNEFKRA